MTLQLYQIDNSLCANAASPPPPPHTLPSGPPFISSFSLLDSMPHHPTPATNPFCLHNGLWPMYNKQFSLSLPPPLLNEHNLLCQSQSGFHPQHSCHTALAKLCNNWLSAVNNSDIVGAVFLELKKKKSF